MQLGSVLMRGREPVHRAVARLASGTVSPGLDVIQRRYISLTVTEASPDKEIHYTWYG